jgi:hypothetical protein
MPQPLGLNTPLNAASVTLADYPTGLNLVRFDIDPNSYSPFNVPIRGSSVQVLDGSVVHQFFGLNAKDFGIEVSGQITAIPTLEAIWTKYRQGGGGAQFIWNDWYGSSFQVIFTPGADSFHPVYLLGTQDSFDYTMSLRVLSILSWFGNPY